MALLDFIFTAGTNALIQNYFTTVTSLVGNEVRGDANLGFTIQPVIANPSGSTTLYSPDALDTDSYQFSIGLADQAASGGTFKLTAGATTTGLTVLAYNIPAATLQTPLSAAFVTEGKSACTVTLISTGVYQIVGNSNGAIATGFLVGDGTNLTPNASAFVVESQLGSASTPYKLLLIIRASPLVYAEPATLLTAAGVTLSTTAAGSATSNKIQKISFDAANTYGGTYKITASAGAAQAITAISIANPTNVTVANHGFPNGATIVFAGSNSTPTIDGSRVVTVVDANSFTVAVNVTGAGTQGTAQYTQDTTCGVAPFALDNAQLSPAGLAQVLAGHPQIFYNETDGEPNNIVVTQSGQDYFVEFTGTLGDSTAPALTLTNIDLVAPKGVSGQVDLNTIPLWEYSLTQSGETFDLLVSITRTRATGEIRTIFPPTTITILKDLVDPTTMAPPLTPTYITKAQGDTYYGQLAASNTWAMTQTFSSDIAVAGNAQVGGGVLCSGNGIFDLSVVSGLAVFIGTGGGANTASGTFTVAGGAATVSNTTITANSVILTTLKTVSGTPLWLKITPTASTGFAVSGGGADNSTYNYVIIEAN